MTANFCNLHHHTTFSTLDGYGTVKQVIDRVLEMGQSALAVTEHGNMSSVLEVKSECEKNGIKWVPGQEFYIAPWGKDVSWRREDNKRTGTGQHLTVWAYSQEGYGNMLKLTELANQVGFYHVPRIDYDMLSRYNAGLITTTSCMAGAIPSALNPETGVKASDYRRCNEILEFMYDVFGLDRYFIELQGHDIAALREINVDLFRLNKNYGFDYIVTGDSHYPRPEDSVGQVSSMCVSQKCSVLEPNDFIANTFLDKEYYMLDIEAAKGRDYGFSVPDSAFTNTVKVAEMVETIYIGNEPEVKKYRFPVMPEYEDNYNEHLTEIAMSGFMRRYRQGGDLFVTYNPEALERLRYELKIINNLGFASYFLCVYDISRYCIEENIPMTVRGSAGGSIVLYCLGVTDFCPLEYNLIFERFLNPDRVSAPDADLDIDPNRRAEVIKYIVRKYGAAKVAQVATFSYIRGRGAIRDAARLNEAPFHVGDEMIARMSDDDKVTVTDTISNKSEYYVNDFIKSPLEQDILDTAIRLEGQIRTVGIHAGAVLLSDRSLVKDYPLMRPKSTSKSVTNLLVAIDYESAEELGGIKLDILGVQALGILYETMRMVNEYHGTNYTFDTLPVDDEQSFDLICRGELAEIFQLSGYTARVSTDIIQPKSIIDVMVANSICRPGPNKYEQVYADRLHGRADVEYKHPNLAEVLADTQGIMLYQESVMRVSQLVAGFTGRQADTLRKAISKKKGFNKIKRDFINGAKANGYDDEFIDEIWNDMVEFAGYGFNMAHSCAYARIAVKQAYLKSKYPYEYYAAAMTGRGKNEGKLDELLREMAKVNIKLLPPRLGYSEPFRFSIDDENEGIRYPYGSIKNVGKAGIHLEHINLISIDMITDQQLALFKKAGIRALTNLALVGTFDHLFDGDRNMAVLAVPYLSQGLRPMIQLSLVEEEDKYSETEFLAFEREFTGLYLTRHPLDDVPLNQVDFADQKQYERMAGETALFVGVVNDIRTHRDSGGNLMAFVKIEDRNFDEMSVVIFAPLYHLIHDRIEHGAVIKVLGTVNVRYGRTDEEEAKLKKYGRVSILASNIIGSN